MDEYINRNKLLEEINRNPAEEHSERCAQILEALLEAPAAEVEPVRHGRWIVQKCECISTTFECSECGRTVDASNDYFAKPTEHIAKQYPYCHCGAKMDGGADNG